MRLNTSPSRIVVTVLSGLALTFASQSAFAKKMESAACSAEIPKIVDAPDGVFEITEKFLGDPEPVTDEAACESLGRICAEACSSYDGQRPTFTCGLTPAEFAILRYYTNHGYGCINAQLRAANILHSEPFIQALNNGLGKIPNFVGFVNRGANLPNAVIEQHQVGAVLEYPSFTSTSLGSGFGGNVKYKIFSKTGKPVMAFSGHKGEREILFRAPTRFKVLSKTPGTPAFIVMKEVTPGLSAAQEAEEDQDFLNRYKDLGAAGVAYEKDWICNSKDKAVWVETDHKNIWNLDMGLQPDAVYLLPHVKKIKKTVLPPRPEITKAFYGETDVTKVVQEDLAKHGKILNCVNHYGQKRIVNPDMTVTLEMEVTYVCKQEGKKPSKPKTQRLFCNPYDAYFVPQCQTQ